MLVRALKTVLPDGVYPVNIEEYLKWDDCKVIQALKENLEDEACRNIISRIVYSRVCYTKTHPAEADKREFHRNHVELSKKVGKENLIVDKSAGKMPHKIPKRVEFSDEKAIIIYDEKTGRMTTISEESEIINALSEKIDIMRIYCAPDVAGKAFEYIKGVNNSIMEDEL